MEIDKINISFTNNSQSHFNDDTNCIFDIIFVSTGKVFNMSDILINIDIVKDIEFLSTVLGHEFEHIILFEIFNYKTSIQYDNIYDFNY